MTEKRQFCPKGHDTFKEGRDSSYRCIRCKREASRAARTAREAETYAARRAELEARQAEADKRYAATRRRVLKAGGPAAKQFLWEEVAAEKGLCQWTTEDGWRYCMSKAKGIGYIYCARHERVLEERIANQKAERAEEMSRQRDNLSPPPPVPPVESPEPGTDQDPPQVVPGERPPLRGVTAWGERGWTSGDGW